MSTTSREIELLRELLTLLDRIEMEDDASLAEQRFKILEKYGTVELGPETSGTHQ